ncbi:hypothetical protein F5Y18DRAFT_433623 [Xylariaceae sp. FL1019]|nr:hypothetical protein F5Y18DRAFT_433623 [Xylariaceae sp. FL1019]
MADAVLHACWEQHGDLGRFMGTAFLARDLEEIRKAVNEEELTGVGRVILDGTGHVRDHRLLGGFGWTALDNVTDVWHDGFLGECVNAGPKYCALAQPRDGETVSVQDLETRMHSLMKSLIHRPIPGYSPNGGPSLVTYSSLVGAIYGALYNAHAWPALAHMLFELESGNSTLATLMLDEQGWEFDPTLPSSPSPKLSSDELDFMVICVERIWVWSFGSPCGLP